ncbi:MAG: UDP-galactopyranose mutase [Methanobacterium sp.]
MYDYIIVGAGLAGCVMAERIANVLNKKVLLIEKRDHVGGNCYDYYDENGILVHKYGPHIFHTDMKHVWEYLSQFTEWFNYQHKVLGCINNKMVPLPFNLNSLHVLFSKDLADDLERKLIDEFGWNAKIPIMELNKVKDKDLKFLADFIYEKVFLNYTKKQWGMKPEDLDPLVTGRVPILTSKDDNYFNDKYQGLPKFGYNKMFQNMLSNRKINVRLGIDYKEIINIDYNENGLMLFGEDFQGELIYTGRIDEFFNYYLGELPYRSLNFVFENLNQNHYQNVGVVNYPNEHEFTRITEFKHLTGQISDSTTITKEYPRELISENCIPYYPIPKKEGSEIYQKYKMRSIKFNNLILVGRLAEYKYYDMDQVVVKTLEIFEDKLLKNY